MNIIIIVSFIGFAAAKPSFTIDYEHNQFLKDGAPFRYVSGDLEYFKVPSALWRDRMIKHKAAGLNAIQTYIEWNSHEPERGVYNFQGDLDLIAFLKLAHELGFVVVLRPGPYINAEREFGGLPYWLLSVNPNMKLRTMDSSYINELNRWFSVLLPKLVPLLYNNGGPIITVQVENEYGFLGHCDGKYLGHIKDLYHKYLGNDTVLFTTDPAFVAKCGKVEGALTTIDFGSKSDPTKEFGHLREIQPHGPLVNSEYYPGWIHEWEEPYSNTPKEIVCKTLDKILAMNASVNIYPLHGGTQFGFGAGSESDGKNFSPLYTSYDFDAPLNEAGDPTPKYFAVRNVIGKYLPLPNMTLPVVSPKMQLKPIAVIPIKSIYDNTFFTDPIESKYPLTFAALNLRHGFVLYSTIIKSRPSDPALLTVNGLADRAHIFIDGKYQGILSRTHSLYKILIPAKTGQRLDIFVEDQGRVTFGLIHDPKGINGNVTLGSVTLENWKQYRYFVNWSAAVMSVEKNNSLMKDYDNTIPTFYSGHFTLPDDPKLPHDTFLRLDGWKKGIAFLNGFNLGRYWPVAGPQITLYAPANLFKKHPQINTITLFDLEGFTNTGQMSVKFVEDHVLNGPTPDTETRKK